ncbi:hypothetical protein PLESTF_001767200, partial [Pleodorina starrii]
MSSSALPPLAGVSPTGGRDDREEHRTQKVKPLPLMLSSRAPLVQAAGSGLRLGSPTQGATRSRPSGGPQQLQQQQHPDAPPSPGSPTAGAHRSKFIRIRGFQGGQSQGPLGLEGNGLLQQQQQQQALAPGGRPASQQQQQQQ